MSTRQKINKITTNHARENISLDGAWGFKLDPQDVGKKQKWFKNNNLHWDRIEVPGCWQAQGFGYKKLVKEGSVDFKIRKTNCEYEGTGWYRKEVQIPQNWQDKSVWLIFDGLCPAGEVWVNGKFVGSHAIGTITYNCEITPFVEYKGNNEIIVRIYKKNIFTKIYFLYFWISYWSGIFGRVRLEASSGIRIEDIFVKPRIDKSIASVEINIANGRVQSKAIKQTIKIIGKVKFSGEIVSSESKIVEFKAGSSSHEIDFPLKDVKLWSPKAPHLYEAEISIMEGNEIVDSVSTRFGMREFTISARKLYLNGERLFLRGYGDDAIFPDTHCPPVDIDYYRKSLQVAKSYGFNYVNQYYTAVPEFFEAADEAGMLVQGPLIFCHDFFSLKTQNDLPMTDLHPNHPVYLQLKEAFRQWIMRYRNHPSLMTHLISAETGSNYPGLIACYNDLYKMAKKLDPTRLVLSRAGSDEFNTLENSDLIERYVQPGRCEMASPTGYETDHIGMNKQINHALRKPYLLHEYGYVSSYPNPALKKSYQGRILPYWIEVAERVANKKGVGHLLPKFVENSEKLQRITRKIAIEEARKMPELSGYILWLFQDTCCAVEGLVDDFYGSKNVTPQDFLRSNGETVLLIERKSPTLEWGEYFKAEILISHHSSCPIDDGKLSWKIFRENNQVYSQGEAKVNLKGFVNVQKIGDINFKTPQEKIPQKVVLDVQLNQDTKVLGSNSWDFWIFPSGNITFPQRVFVDTPHYWLHNRLDVQSKFPNLQGIHDWDLVGEWKKASLVVTNKIGSYVKDYLLQGGKVLLISKGFLPELPCRYRTVLWNGGDKMGNLGTIIEPHPALGNFPHEGWCDLQFRLLFENAGNINLDVFPVEIEPIIRIIDGYRWCRTRAHLVEFGVGKGKILATSFNFSESLGILPEANYLFSQLVNYALSDIFRPKRKMGLAQFLKITRGSYLKTLK
ncbi:MAG: hypothetical protein L6437_15955 [Kiritimatiellae bacterium]|nr:hypothetical protein [Kiritimatiellia bacterium]